MTHKENVPHAILIRAIQPTHGIPTILMRRKKKKEDPTLTKGPARIAQGLGINTSHSGLSVVDDQIWLEDRGITIPKDQIIATSRIGVDYAQKDKDLPYRFVIAK